MIEPDLKDQLEKINKNVELVARQVGGSWKSLWYGLLRGFGSLIGVAVGLVLIGWVLNTLGYIPALQNQVNHWKEVIQRAQDTTPLKQSK
jgi:Na+/melibiose symporter-like transporter